ncbi:MAG: pitrilysin family protein, partial [Chitinophagaceae bacterium]
NRLASVSGKVSTLAAYQSINGNANLITTELSEIRNVTKADVMRVYHQYIKGKPAVILSVLTKGQENLRAAADNYTVDTTRYLRPDYGYAGLKYVKSSDKFDRKKMPAAGANPVVKVPPFWTKNLNDGMKVIGTENNEIPVVTLRISLKGGRMMDANMPDKAGLASMFASMMNESTTNYTSEQFSLELAKLGSSINIGIDDDATVISVQSLKKNLPATLKLLEEKLLRPKFDQADFDRNKNQTLEGIRNSKSQPAVIASQVYNKINYGGGFWGLPAGGTMETVKNITLDDVKDYYKNNISIADGKIVVVGDITEASILPMLAFLNQLPKKPVVLPAIAVKPAPVGKTKIYLIDVPKGAQTEFRVGYVTALPYDATGEFYKATLANYPLGTGFNSRLNINLREDKGWTYGARSGIDGNKYTSSFTFSSGIRADATDSAMAEVVREIKNYTANGVKPEEIDFMRNSIGQSDARNYETGFQKAAFLGRILEYNLPADFTKKQSDIRKNITKAEMDAETKKYLDFSKMNIVLAGDKKLILPGLQKLGYEIVEVDADGNAVGSIL